MLSYLIIHQRDMASLQVFDDHWRARLPASSQPGHVTTSMPGTIVEVLVKLGDTVKAGDPVLVCEAMKMETEVQAPIAGQVRAVHVAKGDAVSPDEALIEIG